MMSDINHHDRFELRPIDVKDRFAKRDDLAGKTIEELVYCGGYSDSTLVRFTDGTFGRFGGSYAVNYASIPWDQAVEIGLVTEEERQERKRIVEEAMRRKKKEEKIKEVMRMKRLLEEYAKENNVDIEELQDAN